MQAKFVYRTCTLIGFFAAGMYVLKVPSSLHFHDVNVQNYHLIFFCAKKCKCTQIYITNWFCVGFDFFSLVVTIVVAGAIFSASFYLLGGAFSN